MPRIPGNGSKPANVTSSHETSTTSKGETRDRAEHDNGTDRYNWDVYTDAQGDHRGSIGTGRRGTSNDVYGRVDFNEDSGRVKGTVGGEQRFGDKVRGRGEAGLDNKGNVSGEVGGRYGDSNRWVDGQVEYNESTGRVGGKVKGRYRINKDTRSAKKSAQLGLYRSKTIIHQRTHVQLSDRLHQRRIEVGTSQTHTILDGHLS